MNSTLSPDHVKYNFSLNSNARSSASANSIQQTKTGCLTMDMDTSHGAHKNTRNWVPSNIYKEANSQKRVWLNAVASELPISASCLETLEALAFNCDPLTGIGSPSIGHIIEHRKTEASYNTIRNHLSWLVENSVLKKSKGSRKGIKRNQTPPNVYELVGFKFELVDYSSKIGTSLNITKIKDLNTKQTKEERVSICDNLYEEYSEIRSKPKTREVKMKTENPQKPSLRLNQTEEMELTKLKNDFKLTDSEFRKLKERYILGRSKSQIDSPYAYANAICIKIEKERNETLQTEFKAKQAHSKTIEKLKEMDKWKEESIPKPSGVDFRKMLGLR